MKKYELIKIDGDWWTNYLYKRFIEYEGKEKGEFIKKYAKEIALLKWDIIIKDGGKLTLNVYQHPLLSLLSESCSYCQVFYKGMIISNGCNYCPLGADSGLCCSGFYRHWDEEKTTANAKAVRKYIYKTKYVEPNIKIAC